MNVTARPAYAQSLPLGGTPTLSQLSTIDEISRVAIAEFVRRGAKVPNLADSRLTGRYVLLGNLSSLGGDVATLLRFEAETYVETSEGSGSYEATQFWIDSNGTYAFESPDSYLYEDDEL